MHLRLRVHAHRGPDNRTVSRLTSEKSFHVSTYYDMSEVSRWNGTEREARTDRASARSSDLSIRKSVLRNYSLEQLAVYREVGEIGLFDEYQAAINHKERVLRGKGSDISPGQ